MVQSWRQLNDSSGFLWSLYVLHLGASEFKSRSLEMPM